MKNFAPYAATHLGLTVSSSIGPGTPAFLIIDRLSDKIGTMKSGQKAPYVELRGKNATDGDFLLQLHPEQAKRLFNKGQEGALRILGDLTKSIEAADEEGPAIVKEDVSTDVLATAGAETVENTSQTVESTEPASETQSTAQIDSTPVSQAAEPSKKDRFMTIFRLGGTRKEIREAVRSFVPSEPGFATYYQNAKSGKWV